MSDKQERNLGWMNSWKYPDDERYTLIRECQEAKHKTDRYSDGRGYNRTRCKECGYVYECDSSG